MGGFLIITFVAVWVLTLIVIISNSIKANSNKNEHKDASAPSYNNSDEKPYQRRAKEFIEAAERGDAEAQFRLAEIYEYHEGDKYIYWLEKAVAQGHSEAIRELADDYQYGNEHAIPPIEVNLEKTIEILKILADKGDAEAMKDIAICYALDYDDADAAREWTERAANAGDEDSILEIGDEYRDAGDYSKAQSWYNKAIEVKCWVGYLRLGDMYKNGTGFAKDETKAFELYTKAAEKGYNYALTRVAECYLNGWGVERNEREAFLNLETAANTGLDRAEYMLGTCYFEGVGVEKNYKRAIEYFQKAKSNPEALSKLGECYYSGYGVKKNTDRAHELWHEAAEKGCDDAILNLKTCFYETIEPCNNRHKSLVGELREKSKERFN